MTKFISLFYPTNVLYILFFSQNSFKFHHFLEAVGRTCSEQLLKIHRKTPEIKSYSYEIQ